MEVPFLTKPRLAIFALSMRRIKKKGGEFLLFAFN
jgi:hypothetical protein